MTQDERDALSELLRRRDEKAPADLMILFEHANPLRRAEMREYMAGWVDGMQRITELRDVPAIAEFLRKIEGEGA